MRLILGPYQLGESVMIKCLVVGGRPSPDVTWWRDHHLVDDSFAQNSEFRVENMLTLPSLERSDVDSILTCQAKNSNNSLPLSTSVKLDMVFGPETVAIHGLPHSLSRGEKYLIQCEAVGSRPVPDISWRIGDTDVRVLETSVETSPDKNVTVSTISLLAEPGHNGETISCSASVPGLINSRKSTVSMINVHYISSAAVSLGSSMTRSERIKEGDDVYLECNVDANPRPHRISWFKNGVMVKQDITRGVILSNMSLVIQSVTRDTRGDYTCLAVNTEDTVTSSPLSLDVDHKPVCSAGLKQEYQVSLNHQVN